MISGRPAPQDRLPEISGVVGAGPVHVDHARVAPGPVADEAVAIALQIDRQGQPVDEARLAARQHLAPVQLSERRIVQRHVAAPEADLRQPRAAPHHDRERCAG